MAIGSEGPSIKPVEVYPTQEEIEAAKDSTEQWLWWDVPKVAHLCKRRQGRQLAATILITGEWGAGKTQLSYQLAKAIDKNFALERNIMLSPDALEIARKIDDMQVNPCPVLDEAVLSLYNQNWADKSQKAFYQYINATLRKEKQGVLIMNIPSIFDMRGSFLRGQVNMWFHVISPGVAACMLRNPGPFPDVFFREELLSLWKKMARKENVSVENQYSLEFQLKVYRSHKPSFFRFITFNRMSDEEYGAYLKYYGSQKHRLREDLFAQAEEDEQMKKARKLLGSIAGESAAKAWKSGRRGGEDACDI